MIPNETFRMILSGIKQRLELVTRRNTNYGSQKMIRPPVTLAKKTEIFDRKAKYLSPRGFNKMKIEKQTKKYSIVAEKIQYYRVHSGPEICEIKLLRTISAASSFVMTSHRPSDAIMRTSLSVKSFKDVNNLKKNA
uniref:Uncharacterized protein n=1 Tax=Romanomermis culicivorax TaxID=13658 RepID=A0A915J0X4_ROMCU